MTAEKPEVRLYIEFGANQPLAVFATGLVDFTDAVEHQHWRQRQLRVARAKHLSAATRQQILVFITAAPIQHTALPLPLPVGRSGGEMDPFRMGSAPILVKRRVYRRSGCPCGNRRSLCEAAKLSPRALYHRAPQAAKHRARKMPLVPQ